MLQPYVFLQKCFVVGQIRNLEIEMNLKKLAKYRKHLIPLNGAFTACYLIFYLRTDNQLFLVIAGFCLLGFMCALIVEILFPKEKDNENGRD